MHPLIFPAKFHERSLRYMAPASFPGRLHVISDDLAEINKFRYLSTLDTAFVGALKLCH